MAETVQRQEILEEEEPLQGKFESVPQREIPEEENHTGMPDNLKTGLEQLSGLDLSYVRVHQNSSKPEKVGALAYTRGTDIHLGPGKDRHLPHEGWHVVQQVQGRVKPTMKIMGLALNDEPGLEKEADVMGVKANQPRSGSLRRKEITGSGSEEMKRDLILPVNNPGVVQQVRKGELTLGILGTVFSLGFAWLSPGFRKYMRNAWYDDEYREKLEENGFRITAGLDKDESALFSRGACLV